LRTIPPDKTGIVEASFDSKNFKGSVVKTVDIYSNDPLTPVKTVRLSGTVKAVPAPELAVNPALVNVGNIKEGELITREVELINSGELELRITEILNTPGCRTEIAFVENKKVEIPSGEGRPIELLITPMDKKIMKVICNPNVPRGRFQGSITIKSNAKRIPVYVLFINGFIEQD
jgi:hypothetical protein